MFVCLSVCGPGFVQRCQTSVFPLQLVLKSPSIFEKAADLVQHLLMCHTDSGLSRSRFFEVFKMVNSARQSACLIKPFNPKVCSAGPDDGTGIKQPGARRWGEAAHCVLKGEIEEGFEQCCAGMESW